MVVDDVEDDADPEGVRPIDEGAEVVGRAVEPGRREQVDAVVAPAEPAGEVVHGHDLDDGDAQIGEVRQLAARRCPGPLGREGADVQLVDDLALEPHALPVRVRPRHRRRIDHLRWPVRPLRLVAGGGVGVERLVVVEPEPIQRAMASGGSGPREITARLGRERDHRARDVGAAGLALDHEVHRLAPRRPYPELDATARQNLRPDGQPAGALHLVMHDRHSRSVEARWPRSNARRTVTAADRAVKMNLSCPREWRMSTERTDVGVENDRSEHPSPLTSRCRAVSGARAACGGPARGAASRTAWG